MPYPGQGVFPDEALFLGISYDIDLNGIADPPYVGPNTRVGASLRVNQLGGGIPSAEDVGSGVVPGPPQTILMSPFTDVSAVGQRMIVLKVGAQFRLINPSRTDHYRLPSTANGVMNLTNTVGFTVWLDDSAICSDTVTVGSDTIVRQGGGAIHIQETPLDDYLQSAQKVWRGGHDNISTDVATLYLWLANNFDVEIL